MKTTWSPARYPDHLVPRPYGHRLQVIICHFVVCTVISELLVFPFPPPHPPLSPSPYLPSSSQKVFTDTLGAKVGCREKVLTLGEELLPHDAEKKNGTSDVASR